MEVIRVPEQNTMENLRKLFSEWTLDEENDDKFKNMVEFVLSNGFPHPDPLNRDKTFLREQYEGWCKPSNRQEKLVRRICIANMIRFELEVEHEHEQIEREENEASFVPEEVHLTEAEKLERLTQVFFDLVHVYQIRTYASKVPLNLACKSCHLPFIEDENENDHYCSHCLRRIKERKRTFEDIQDEDKEGEEV